MFVPPFKKQRVVVQDSSSEAKRAEKEDGEDKCNCVTPVHIKSFVPPTDKSPSTRDAPDCKGKEDIRSAADTSRKELEINQNLPFGWRSEDSARETSCKEAKVLK